MSTNRDWHIGKIELPAGTDVALAAGVAGAAASFTVTAAGNVVANHVTAGGIFSLGAAESATVASGVLTVTSSHVNVLPESSTSDTVDTITMVPTPTGGEVLLLTSKATNTITVDDANVNLAAATRAIAPGGSLVLFFDGDEWTEHSFVAATDNA